jgi:hypothetical protein
LAIRFVSIGYRENYELSKVNYELSTMINSKIIQHPVAAFLCFTALLTFTELSKLILLGLDNYPD